MKRILTVVMVLLTVCSQAQDPEFTQFYAAPLYLNPAMAGTARCPRISMNYRNQWPALGTFVTYAASYDQHVDALGGGLGLLVTNDKAGEGSLTTSNIAGIYSYQLNMSRKVSMKVGFQGTFVQKSIDWDALTFGDMIDPRFGFIYQTQEVRPDETKSFVDFSTGVLVYSSKVYAGLAVDHLTQPDEAFISPGSGELPMKITAHAGAMLPVGDSYGSDLDEGLYLSPNVLYSQQGKFNQLNVGMYAIKSPVVGGVWYRGNFDSVDGKFIAGDSFIALIGIQRGSFKFGYSYDVTVSQLSRASSGSHELSLGIQFECRPKRKRFRAIKCPAF